MLTVTHAATLVTALVAVIALSFVAGYRHGLRKGKAASARLAKQVTQLEETVGDLRRTVEQMLKTQRR